MASGNFGGYSVASILGMVLGAVVGAGAESSLQADRELRRQSFLRSQDAHNLWIQGRTEGDKKKIDMARFQIAAYGSNDQIMAVRNWMKYEDEQSKIEVAKKVEMADRKYVPIDTCPPKTHPEMQYYMTARHSTKPPNFSLFTLLTSISFAEPVPDEIVAEVALRCFLKNSDK
ncbi:MAG: hypothetical protein KDJ47_14620 [Hyphomicrobiaceae bacterium]|nr:hypothetical protein [Hyphomicrobiaceae bacterium]